MKISECSMRVDNDFIVFWNIKGEQYIIPRMLYEKFRQHIMAVREGKTEEKGASFINDSKIKEFVENNSDIVLKAIEDSLKIEAPSNSLAMAMTFNIQVDDGVKFIDREIMMDFLKQAVENKILNIVFRGSKVLKNKDIIDAIKFCRENNMYSFIELKDDEFDQASLQQIIAAGAYMLKLPIDFSTEGARTIDFARKLTNCTKNMGFSNCILTWIAKNDNINDVERAYAFVEECGAIGLQIDGYVPESDDDLELIPTKQNFEALYKIIRPYKKGRIMVTINKCYSPLRAYAGKSFLLTNTNKGISRGCGAGRDEVTLNVDGLLQPCFCLNMPEDISDIKEYWYTSKKLYQLRNIEEHTKMPCNNCEYNKFCIPCFAINNNIEDKLYKGGYNSCSVCIDD